ncbi:hypothetical protein R1sor_008998 [Riccia sorocarpa]|uniref:Uncharacterized protein n=1 Tax=Riccia sorocarpa TaxID=122646 RepID=A0ABD3H8G6_9MARC
MKIRRRRNEGEGTPKATFYVYINWLQTLKRSFRRFESSARTRAERLCERVQTWGSIEENFLREIRDLTSENRPTLYDLWREFRYFANVTDRRYLSHLEFFIEAKAGRFFGSKKSSRRPILLSSLTGFEEELEKVKTYLFWKRRQFRRPSLTPKSILMALKMKKDRSAKTHAKASTPKTTPTPSSSNPSTPKAKMGPCKPIALPTTELKKFRPQFEDLGLGFLF